LEENLVFLRWHYPDQVRRDSLRWLAPPPL